MGRSMAQARSSENRGPSVTPGPSPRPERPPRSAAQQHAPLCRCSTLSGQEMKLSSQTDADVCYKLKKAQLCDHYCNYEVTFSVNFILLKIFN